QGGPCSDSDPSLTYHNSFLIVDNHDAWVLETAGKYWAAERIESGFRNISNCLSISTKIDLMSDGLKEAAVKNGLWSGNGEFNFANVFGNEGEIKVCGRYQAGLSLLKNLTESHQFDVNSMLHILRDDQICRGIHDSFPTQASQVSVLSSPGSNRAHCHWFTCTPDARVSAFKPFIFVKNVKQSQKTCSPAGSDRKHVLYARKEKFYKQCSKEEKEKMRKTLREMEATCIEEVEDTLDNFDANDESLQLSELFNDTVEAELRFYK
ncbi:Secernin-2-like protein, partial [Leptotrombidium deliense]